MTTTADKVKNAVKNKTAETAPAKGATKAATAPADGEKKVVKRNPPDVVLANLLTRRAALVAKHETKLAEIDNTIEELKAKKKIMPISEAAKQLKALGLSGGEDAKNAIAEQIKKLQALSKAADKVTEADLAALDVPEDEQSDDTESPDAE